MKTARWLGFVLLWLLAGCRPEQVAVSVGVKSERCVIETVVAVLPETDRELFEATVRRLGAESKWHVRERPVDGRVRASLTRRLDPERDESVKVERRVCGPLWLRHEYTVTLANPLKGLPAGHPIATALSAQNPAIALRIALPGRVVADDTSNFEVVDGAAQWTIKAAAAPPTVVLTSRAWRKGLLLLLLAVLVLVLWIAWPAILPPPEVRATRAAQRAQRRAAKQQREAEQQQRAAQKQAQRAERDAAKAAKQEAKAAQEEQAEAVVPEPEAEPESGPGPTPPAPAGQSQQAVRRRRNLRIFRRRR